jgi:hypothetical protein
VIRKRGLVFILASVPGLVFVYRFVDAARRSEPFGYEFGSVAWPMPAGVRIVEIFALLLAVIGLSLFVFDLVQGIRGRLREERR